MGKWYMCLNWIDVFLCQEVNVREKEAECAGRLPPVAKSSIQWRAYKELFLLYITALSSSDISRKDFHLLFSISLNHRTNQVGRDLWRSLIQHPARSKANCKGRWGCSRLCPVEVWPSLGWRVYHLSGLLFQSFVFPPVYPVMGRYIKNLADVKVINVNCRTLVYQASHLVTEDN